MKRIIYIIILSLLVVFPTNVFALSVDNNNITIAKNNSENLNLYANVEEEITEIKFSLVYTTYDIPGYFNAEPGYTDNNPGGPIHSITFSEPQTGNIKLGTIKINVVANPQTTAGSINIYSASAITTEGERITLNSQLINVTINNNPEPPKQEQIKESEEDNKRLLDRIESDIVKIEIEDNIYEYSVNIKKDIEELDLKPIPTNESYKVEISTQKIKELEDNQIIIKISNENKTEEYKIKVNIIEVEEIEIDESEFESTYSYKGKWTVLIVILTLVLFAGLLLTKKK